MWTGLLSGWLTGCYLAGWVALAEFLKFLSVSIAFQQKSNKNLSKVKTKTKKNKIERESGHGLRPWTVDWLQIFVFFCFFGLSQGFIELLQKTNGIA